MPASDAVVVLAVRPESKRVPNKIFYNIAGKTVLKHILDRLTEVGYPVVLAVPDDFAWAARTFLGRVYVELKIFHGDSDSPLHRVANAARCLYPEARYIVRVTGDDPLVDARTITELVEACKQQGAVYGSTPEIIKGCGVEVVLAEHWGKVAEETKVRTEMSTYFLKQGLSKDQILSLKPRETIRRPYRLELDYPEDGLLLNILLRILGVDATADQVAEYLDSHSYLLGINRLPILSFYTCVRNGEQFIDRTIMSIFNCGFPVKEYIIVDNSSTDKTVAHLGAYACAAGVKLLFNDKDIGLADSANLALDECRGTWVMRVDADDLLIPDTIEPMLEFAARNELDIVYPHYNEVDVTGRYTGVGDNSISHHAGGALMRRSFLAKLRFKEGLKLGDSRELYERASRLGKIGYYRGLTWLYRKHGGSLTSINAG